MRCLFATLTLFSFLNLSHAEETMGEKAKVTTNSAQRAKNRVGEETDIIQDKAGEIKNNVDSDEK